MKKFVLLLLPLALLCADEKKPAKAAKTSTAVKSAKPAAKPAPAPAAVTVPADATELAHGVWRSTDAAGKTWIYRQTPFGLSKVEEQHVPASAAAAAPVVEVKATDLGDSVRFEKPGPMGARVWTKKKADLTPEEKDWLEKPAVRTAEK